MIELPMFYDHLLMDNVIFTNHVDFKLTLNKTFRINLQC